MMKTQNEAKKSKGQFKIVAMIIAALVVVTVVEVQDAKHLMSVEPAQVMVGVVTR